MAMAKTLGNLKRFRGTIEQWKEIKVGMNDGTDRFYISGFIILEEDEDRFGFPGKNTTIRTSLVKEIRKEEDGTVVAETMNSIYNLGEPYVRSVSNQASA